MLGMTDWVPKFVKKNADLKGEIEQAAQIYAAEVKSRAFPADAQTYKLRKTAKS
jgi:3-methyl-2-oxobutanoate hydroxymethyltransferase